MDMRTDVPLKSGKRVRKSRLAGMSRGLCGAVLLAAAVLWTPEAAEAATFKALDVQQLRSAVANSNTTSGIDTIELEAIDYDLGGQPLELTDGVILIGSEGTGGKRTRLIGNGNRVLVINEAMTPGFPNVEIKSLTITGGKSPDGDPIGGAGILAEMGTATLSLYDVGIEGNETAVNMGSGAGLYVSGAAGGKLKLDRVTVKGNKAAVNGGGLYLDGDLGLEVVRSTFENNVAEAGAGGGIAFLPQAGTGVVDVTDSAFIGNRANGLSPGGAPSNFGIGGGIALQISKTNITNSTFSGNYARDGGGGINAGAGGSPVLKHVTISDNESATKPGGGLLIASGTPQLLSSIVADNRSTAFPDHADIGMGSSTIAKLDPTTSMNNVLRKVKDTLSGTAGAGGNLILPDGANAGLLPLADNGGFTKSHALAPNSPARSAGGASDVEYDQRGFPRLLASAPAAGAYEGQRASIRYGEVYTGTFDFRDAAATVSGPQQTAVPADLVQSFNFTPSGTNRTLTVTTAPDKVGDASYVFTVSRMVSGQTLNLTGSMELNVRAVPDLTVDVSHTGSFYQGQIGAVYTLTVTNSGLGPTSAPIILSDTLPSKLTYTAMSGAGWVCDFTAGQCTYAGPLAPGASSSVTLTVNVADDAPGELTNRAAVSGGGEEAGYEGNNSDEDRTAVLPAPRVQTVAVPTAKLYKAGEQLAFTVNYDRVVSVDESGGKPALELTIGTVSKQAVYSGGSGSTALTFVYTIESGLTDMNGIAVGTTLSLNGGTMTSREGAPAKLSLSNIGSTTEVRVKSVIPAINGVVLPANETYREGQELSFEVQFSETVRVTGIPVLPIETGAGTVFAPYTSGSDTSKLVFKYVVAAGSDSAGIRLGPISLEGGTIRDAAGNDAVLTIPAGVDTSGIRFDTMAPSLTALVPPASDTYVKGNELLFRLTVSEPITVDSSLEEPSLAVEIGTASRVATFMSASSSPTELVFRYTVQDGDYDADGIGLGQTLTLGNAVIVDAIGNALVPALPAANLTGIHVNAVAAAITNVLPPASGAYRAGQSLTFTVSYNEPVIVDTSGGTPTLALTIGGRTEQAVYSAVGSPSADKLIFEYTVVSGVNDSDGIQIAGTIELQGGTIQAASGNAALLTFPAVNVSGVTIDTTIPGAPLFVTANGTVFPTGSPVISGTAEPGSAVTVQMATYAPVTSAVGPDGRWSAAFSGVSDGTYPVIAKTIDPAGNESPTSSLSVTIDSVVPNKPVLIVSEPNWTSSDVTVEASGETGNFLEVQVGLAGPWTPYGAPVTVSSEGITTVSARQTSPAGNTSEIASVDVKIDKTAPVIVLLGLPEMTTYLNSPFQDPGVTVTDNIDTGLTATVTGSVYSGQAGTYLLRYNVSDSAGNAASEVSRTIHVVPAPAGLRWDPPSYTIPHRGNGQAAIKLKLNDNTEFNVTAGSVITYSVPGIAELRPDGTVSGLQPGTTVMRAVYGGQTADATVVVQRVLERLEVGAASYSVEAGQSVDLTVRAIYSDGAAEDVTANVSIRIDNPSVATIAGQTLRGITAGRTTLTAEWSGQSVTIPITVTEPDDGGGDDGSTDPGTPSNPGNPVKPNPGNGTDNGSESGSDNKPFVLEIMVDGVARSISIRPEEIVDGRLVINLNASKAATLALPLQLVNQLLGKQEKLQLELNTASGSFGLSLGELLDQAKSESEGAGGLRALSLGIAPAKGTETSSIREALSRVGVPAYSSNPVRFEVRMEQENGRSRELSSMGHYATHTLPAGAGKPASGAVGIRWNESTGEVRFVPTEFRTGQDQTWLAELTDRMSGVYFLIEHPVSFPDVAAHWARKEIELLASMRVVQGRDAGFDPNGAVTRAELAALLTRVLGLEASASKTSDFRDIAGGGWYMEPVAAASAAGLVTGYEDGSFRPDAQVTRQEIAVMLLRALRFVGAPLAAQSGGKTFADQADIPDWAAEAVRQAAGLGIAEGDATDSFRPADPASRAEASVMLLRFMRHAGLSPW